MNDELEERHDLYLWRYREAREAGLTIIEARLFAESPSVDPLGELRKRIEQGVPPEWLAKIIL